MFNQILADYESSEFRSEFDKLCELILVTNIEFQEIGYDQDYAKQVLDRIGSKRLKDNWKQDDSIPQ